MLEQRLESVTRHFCTLFDRNYVFKALGLHCSLLAPLPVVPPDRLLLRRRGEARGRRARATERLHRRPRRARGLRRRLLAVKPDRSPVEYMWTATPSLPLYELGTRPELEEVTYLDADLMFFSDPEPIFEELGDDSVLITPHRFSPELAHHAINGIYNVQFLTFRRDERGLEALNWWHDRCIEWCYYRFEDGKLGDQKYLDDWPERFEGVHVSRHKGCGLAPWNITQFDVRETPDGIYVDEDPLIFFHYHRVRLLEDGYLWRPPGYYVSPEQPATRVRPLPRGAGARGRDGAAGGSGLRERDRARTAAAGASPAVRQPLDRLVPLEDAVADALPPPALAPRRRALSGNGLRAPSPPRAAAARSGRDPPQRRSPQLVERRAEAVTALDWRARARRRRGRAGRRMRSRAGAPACRSEPRRRSR